MIESKLEERGIFIKWTVFRNKETTLSEKVLFLEINNLSMLDKGCIASNSHFADTLGVKKEAISRLISSLEKKGYITTEIVDGSRNHSRIITINKMLSTDNKMLFRGKQNVNTPLTNCLESKENKTINKTINKTSNKKENDLNYSFEDFWVLVPKGHKKKPELARKHFDKHSAKPLFPKSLKDLKDSLIPFSAMCEFKYKYLPNITTWLNDGCYAEDFCIDDLSDKLSTRFTDPRAKREFKKKVENFINSQIEELSDAKNSEYTDVA
jgi:DNA-binding Lrp family transcriptional regulator